MGKIVRGSTGPTKGPTDWARLKAEICDRLDIASEYRALGLVFTESGPKANGFRACHAFGRADGSADDRPSAAVKIAPGERSHGVYVDSGGSLDTLGFFDFALKHGKFGSFLECVKHYADKARVPMGVVETSGGNVIEQIYEYREADGTLSYGVFRMRTPRGSKDFRQYPWRDGRWHKAKGCMTGVKPLPYRLPEWLASPPGTTVYVTEGEKDVDRLMALGMVATTNHQGAKSTDRTWPHFLPYFAGRDVAIIPDNDDAGRSHASRVASLLHGTAGRVRILTLPDLPPHGDVSDWLDRGGSAEALAALALASRDFVPAADVPVPADAATGTVAIEPDDDGASYRDIEVIRLCDVQSKEIQWFIRDKIPRGTVTLLAGMPGLGKSFVTIDIAARLSTGGEIPGGLGECFEPARSLILFAEDPLEYAVKPRLEWAGADCAKIDTIKMIRVGDNRIPFTLEYLNYLDLYLCKNPDVHFVSIDPIASYIGRGSDTNKDTEVRAVMEPLGALAEKHDVAIVVVAHLNKGNSPEAINRVSGSGAFAQYARANWMTIRDKDDKKRSLILSLKNNLSADNSGLAYRIKDGRVIWEVECIEMTAQEYIDEHESKSKRGEPKGGKTPEETLAWLVEFLRTHGARASEVIMAEGIKLGHTRNRIFEAKSLGGIRAKQEWIDGANVWIWKLGDFVGGNGMTRLTGDPF